MTFGSIFVVRLEIVGGAVEAIEVPLSTEIIFPGSIGAGRTGELGFGLYDGLGAGLYDGLGFGW